jgi:hypothetical protein
MDPREAEIAFRNEDSRFIYLALNGATSLCFDAQRHLQEGLARRILLMQANREAILQTAGRGRTNALSSDEVIDLNIHVNSYYVQLRGALDNLAWALQYEFDLLGQGGEESGEIRTQCHLFGQCFRDVLGLRIGALAELLQNRLTWAADLKKLRDPVAHRIPLYVPPAVVSGEEIDRLRDMFAEGKELMKAGRLSDGLARIREGYRIAGFQPYLVTSDPGRLAWQDLHETIARDQTAFAEVVEGVLGALGFTTA